MSCRLAAFLFFLGFAGVLPAFSASLSAPEEAGIEMQVRSILSDHCFACHGPDSNQRKAKLRLDTWSGITAERQGSPAVAPGQPGQSELVRRILSTDPDEMMPPSDQPKRLTEPQKEILVEWIRQGAPWSEHWAYTHPRRPAVPRIEGGDWAQNAIDFFILVRLEKEGISPSPRADPRTLLRRLSFDLTGLPPTPAEVARFADNPSAPFYHAQVDRFLGSPHFGERMAVHWLDLVRYADTVGYHGDQTQNIWPYRDYVIRAFNENKPFDQFTLEQLAGDLLPRATLEQKVASGYNRLNMTTEEGGAQDKEYRIKYAADRVRATSSVWMGATLGCAECHDHKYDPYTLRDFYRFAAFFADLQETGAYPGGNGRRPPEMPVPTPAQADRLRALQAEFKRTDDDWKRMEPKLAESLKQWERGWREAASGSHGGHTGVPAKVAAILQVPASERTGEQQRELSEWFSRHSPEFSRVWNLREMAKKKLADLESQIPLTLVSVSGPPRVTRVLPRGNWLDETGEIVEPDVPAYLKGEPQGNQRLTRLDLARWLTRPDHPLTARVFVNRLWELFFGTGLSKVLDDLGAQGEAPSHPRLLDWLAVEFVESGWDVKHVVRLIVTSNVYQQSSMPRPELRERDPLNRWLARQTRFRLPAEMIRDNALTVSGLLTREIGGRSVKPYQPADYWVYLNFPKRAYEADTGPNQYRRGVYTHWQRTFLHPSLMAFDAPSREECTAERATSNTTLAALALLNDPSHVEAARAFAEWALGQQAEDLAGRLHWVFLRALNRPAHPAEIEALTELWHAEHEHYQTHPNLARELARVGIKPVSTGLDEVSLAAWTAVCRAVLNLHETIVRF